MFSRDWNPRSHYGDIPCQVDIIICSNSTPQQKVLITRGANDINTTENSLTLHYSLTLHASSFKSKSTQFQYLTIDL